MTTGGVASQQSNLRRAIRPPIWSALTTLALPTASARVLPDYLVIGAQRSGTTSLQGVLQTHPDIKSPRLMKGVHYFDTNYGRSLDWYRAHFHTKVYADRHRRRTGNHLIAGEASPYYLFHPAAAERIEAALPDVKMIVLLRDPVGRAISHHRHEVRRGDETLNLQEALDAESSRIEGEEAPLARSDSYVSHAHQDFSYMARGQYADQLERYLSVFEREQLLVIESEEFFASPSTTFNGVLDFLQVRRWNPNLFPRKNATPAGREVSDDALERLRGTFAESNRRLPSVAGREFSWAG